MPGRSLRARLVLTVSLCLVASTFLVSSRGSAAPPAPLRLVELFLVADYELFQIHGADTAAVMRSRVAKADKIFRRDLGIGFHIAKLVVFETPDDPFETPASPTEAQDLNAELGAYLDQIDSDADLAFLFSGRLLAPEGAAVLDGVCNDLPSRRTGVAMFDPAGLIFEHELGHNVGATHDTDNGHACIGRYIMFGQSGPHFSPCSKADVLAKLPSKACLLTRDMAGCGGAPDSDGDGVCDPLDPCLSGTPLQNARLKLSALRSTSLSGMLNVGSATFDPVANGVRVVLQGASGGEGFDVTLPGGLLDAQTGRGWSVNLAAGKWHFTSGDLPTGGIVSELELTRDPNFATWLRLKMKGRRGGIDPVALDQPPRATILLDPPNGLCAETGFASSNCRSSATVKTIVCSP